MRIPPREPDEGLSLLEGVKEQLDKEQRRRTANRVAQLFQEGLDCKRALQAQRAAHMSSTVAAKGKVLQADPRAPMMASTRGPRKRPKFYAVRRGRNVGIFHSWEECERHTKGIYSEFKSFNTLEEAQAYLTGPRLNFMAMRKAKPASSFVGGKALRAKIDIWKDGHVDGLRTECGLDTMSDVNLAISELLHDVHDIVVDKVRNASGRSEFAREGTLKVLCDGEVLCLPALVATRAQLPRLCDVLLGVSGLDSLGVCVDQHRAQQLQPLICWVGEKALRTWWEANEGDAAPPVSHDITQVDVCPDLPAVIQAKVRALLQKHESVFEGRQITMPKPFSAEPVELKFVDDPKSKACPNPDGPTCRSKF
jgi:hypothetical protein